MIHKMDQLTIEFCISAKVIVMQKLKPVFVFIRDKVVYLVFELKIDSLSETSLPRANRHFLPGHVWHVTHQKRFLLKFARDRQRYLRWVFEAKKLYGLCVLDYMITSNYGHLLVKDTGPNIIAHSMQLIAGRTAQKGRPWLWLEEME